MTMLRLREPLSKDYEESFNKYKNQFTDLQNEFIWTCMYKIVEIKFDNSNPMIAFYDRFSVKVH